MWVRQKSGRYVFFFQVLFSCSDPLLTCRFKRVGVSKKVANREGTKVCRTVLILYNCGVNFDGYQGPEARGRGRPKKRRDAV
jgi:hypothetical protein